MARCRLRPIAALPALHLAGDSFAGIILFVVICILAVGFETIVIPLSYRSHAGATVRVGAAGFVAGCDRFIDATRHVIPPLAWLCFPIAQTLLLCCLVADPGVVPEEDLPRRLQKKTSPVGGAFRVTMPDTQPPQTPPAEGLAAHLPGASCVVDPPDSGADAGATPIQAQLTVTSSSAAMPPPTENAVEHRAGHGGAVAVAVPPPAPADDGVEDVHQCPVCHFYVEGFDHHCGVIGACIGRRTMPYFVAFLGTASALLGLSSFYALVVAARVATDGSLLFALISNPLRREILLMYYLTVMLCLWLLVVFLFYFYFDQYLRGTHSLHRRRCIRRAYQEQEDNHDTVTVGSVITSKRRFVRGSVASRRALEQQAWRFSRLSECWADFIAGPQLAKL